MTLRSSPSGDASKPTRNGFVHPMILHLLLYASLECSQASVLIDQIIKDNLLSEYEKTELILYVREATPSCWDANAD